ncbi:MAG: hypothetical protein WC071_14090, partial [Victivallaceae bacterium]
MLMLILLQLNPHLPLVQHVQPQPNLTSGAHRRKRINAAGDFGAGGFGWVCELKRIRVTGGLLSPDYYEVSHSSP